MELYFSNIKTAILIITFFFTALVDTSYSQWNNCENTSCPEIGNYTINGGKWYKSELKYYFANGTSDITGDQEKSAFVAALNTWSSAVPFTFLETSNSAETDIYIKFVQDINEWLSSGQTESRVAVSWYPETNCQGVILFNNSYHTFSTEPNPQGAKDLQAVALHELGHIFGLCHSNNSATVMYFDISNPNKRTLHSYDIEGIKSIYATVKVKNEFKNPDGSLVNGGEINAEVNPGDYRDYNTDNLQNKEKSFAFANGYQRRFEAKEQSFQDIDRKFNPFQQHNGGWFFDDGNEEVRIGTSAVISLNVTSGIYKPIYRYKTNIGLTAITEFNGTIPTGLSIGQIYQYDNGNITAPSSFQPIGSSINYNFSGWTDDLNAPTTRTISPTDNKTYTALYKATHKSNSTTAYSNSSQRKFVQTPDGVKHICYSSMNKVWYELSTDGGSTWIMGNGGKPLSSADSKNPSMSFYSNLLGIVWQEKSGSSFKIKTAVFWMNNYQSSLFGTVAEEDGLDYSHNANPVIAWGNGGKTVVVWSGTDLNGCANPFGIVTALRYAYGYVSSYGISWLIQCAIANTDENSINPTITANYSVDSNPFYFHLAWEQVVNSSTSKINYTSIYSDQNNNLLNSGISEASYNSGYSKNYQPSILLRNVNYQDLPYITWLGYRSTPSPSTNVIMRYRQYGSWSSSSVYGNNSVQSFSVNNADYLYGQYVLGLGWSESLSQGVPVYVNKAIKIGSSTTINTLSTTGKDLQINNSSSYSSMFVNSFQSKTIPYSFSLSQSFASLSKENSLAMLNAREGVVGKNGAQFFFALGDISVNGQNINFITVPDSVDINNLESVNNYLASEPFLINESSSLVYGVQYGITDSVLCSSALANNVEINFKVELIDAQTNEVLGVFDEVTYSGQNVYQYNNLGYQVNLSGIGNRTIKFRLVVSTNADFGYSLSNRLADQSLLAKNNYQTVSFRGSLAVTDYSLEQNYPNPFNPSTTIKFQLPKDGFVTLKVYDILGNEISTLINEEKSQGKYEVNFNASSLASGVYIYKIQSGSFTASKKLMLLK